MAPPLVMLTETGSLDGNVSSTARSSFLFRFGCEFSGRALSVPGTILLLGRPEHVGHGRAAQTRIPSRKGNGPLLHSFQVTPDAPPLTHQEASIQSRYRPHRSSEERSRPKPP